MPPFGNLYDVPVWVHHSLAEDEMIVFRAGNHTDTMSLNYGDYARLAKPRVTVRRPSIGTRPLISGTAAVPPAGPA